MMDQLDIGICMFYLNIIMLGKNIYSMDILVLVRQCINLILPLRSKFLVIFSITYFSGMGGEYEFEN